MHGDSEKRLRRWYRIVGSVRWRSLDEVRETFPHADPVKVKSGTLMTVFNVGGNRYRIVARILYEAGRVYIRAVLTHKEYGSQRWKETM